jgi:hypothetical protein
MLEYKELYGADADGNRGIWVTEYELEPSDEPEIIEQILESYPDSEDRPSSMTITIDGIDFDIDVADFLP